MSKHVKVTRVSVEKLSQRYSDIFQEKGAAPPSISGGRGGEPRSQAPGHYFLLKDKFCKIIQWGLVEKRAKKI